MRPSITSAVLTAVLFLASTSTAHALRISPADGVGSNSNHCRPVLSTASEPSASDLGASESNRDSSLTAPESGTKWVVDRADNICGLDDAKMLSKPAKVDYDALLKVTSEMKKMRDDKIDTSSPEGIRLRQAAVDRVRIAADKVRVAEGYCSVWKQIRHQDGRAIPDVTDLVKAQL
jgi:hypothetical protein